MILRLVNSSFVVAAHHFNPTITNQIWLVEHQIVLREELEAGGSVFTDMFAQVPTRSFHLLIAPDQCQFTLNSAVEKPQELIAERIGRLVTTLPHTPYRAVGLNFVWHLIPENDAVNALTRQLFYVPGSSLHKVFDTEDARFGGYLSKDSLGCRLKLDVKPILLEKPGEGQTHLIQFAFNYHLDVSGLKEQVVEIQQMVKRWDEAREESSHIVHTAARGNRS